MTSQTPTLGYDDLAGKAKSYFAAIDNKDLELVLSLFVPDATFTVQTDHVTITGLEELRSMFVGFMGSSKTMLHDIQHITVDERARKVCTEHKYVGELEDGTKNDMKNCNFFDVGEDGRFTRVVIWMAGANPLK
ncbi:nuclear transport factor 2 family protein [Aspergillus affinis]|uniref:nuclear transport factor 2 family protein n=1 Tax=Aspergillus affinis TaxID=1070780 RepID=UPI0022FE2F29|nr:NTF2-like protein [Aspergillus affinis]KAI9042451.1 NTF2-like protein [Aspergillus affinis]